jgi:hypothetical protein
MAQCPEWFVVGFAAILNYAKIMFLRTLLQVIHKLQQHITESHGLVSMSVVPEFLTASSRLDRPHPLWAVMTQNQC